MSDTTTTFHPVFTDGHGLHVVSTEWLDDRTVELLLDSDTLAHPVGTRIVLPAGYHPEPAVRYPLLMLLHGGLGGYRDWTDQGQIASLTEGSGVISVMPCGGRGGWYRDWHNFGRGQAPMWETFHLDQLLPWIDGQLATIGMGSSRAIAGVSMGGFGALSYTARRPGTFAAASSFSGAVNTSFPLVQSLICVSSLAHHRPPFAINRFPFAGRADWHAHNPWHLAESLRGVHLALFTGNGRPTRWPSDERPKDLQENQVHSMNVSLHRRLDELNIDHTWNDYGPATHTWDNWRRSMAEELPALMAVITSAPAGSD